jgi:hypothetical protein
VAELLLDNKADVNAKATDGATPWQWATATGNKDMAEFLRLHGGHGQQINASNNLADVATNEQNKPKVVIEGVVDKEQKMVEPKIVTSKFSSDEKDVFEQRALWHSQRLIFDWAKAGDSITVTALKLTGSFAQTRSMNLSGSTPTVTTDFIFTTGGKEFHAFVPKTAVTPWKLVGDDDAKGIVQFDMTSSYDVTGILLPNNQICVLEVQSKSPPTPADKALGYIFIPHRSNHE